MKDFFAGFGELKLVTYLICVCIGFAPLFHIFIIGSEVSPGKFVLTILGIIYVIVLTTAKIYRKFFWKSS